MLYIVTYNHQRGVARKGFRPKEENMEEKKKIPSWLENILVSSVSGVLSGLILSWIRRITGS